MSLNKANKANLDAWHVLRTVVDVGGFAQAAEQLQRSQSAISYSIHKLQEQIGLELLTTKGRKAVLTANGAFLLARSRELLTHYDNMLEQAESLKMGYEPALSVWIDNLCPVGFLQPVLGEFQTNFPQTAVSIIQNDVSVEANDGDDSHGEADLAITTSPVWATSIENLGELAFIAVAHPNHPVFGCDSPISHSALKEHRRVSVQQAHQQEIASNEVEITSNWLVSTYQQAIQAVLIGQAYGWLPHKSVEQELSQGKLKRLTLEHGERYRLPVYIQYNPQRSAGLARAGLARTALAELIIRYASPYLN